ncbi:BTAD domain-containing putative transcriptional regulator [Planomonospora venezuelensis]|uniref:DNA-binding SARP family transcriptional activator n=1 Tax=Planomonospora venezuelensis TaxID=1999 RepID=A0A841DAM9_PLAVE|nr:BTAD domain-containing putative transcriptional regulator [Planomonospora venezuelensis]MBB5965757.1 DNA-binding SARP family transcriptional activator [Planomonospora venezuelensis]
MRAPAGRTGGPADGTAGGTASGTAGGAGDLLDFRILGPLEVVDASGTALDIGSRKQRAVLALLLLNAPHVLPLDRLIGRLWADEPPSSATGTLQAYISQLRRVLEPRRSPRSPARLLRTREPGYLLDVSTGQVDAGRFAAAAETARAALSGGRPEEVERVLEPVLREWRGEPLADFPDEPFARPTAARLIETRMSALSVRAESWLAMGRNAETAVEAERLLGLDPYREGLWALLMRALYRDRRQAEALAAYQRCRTLLGDELGLDPSPELRRLERAVLDQDEALDGPGGPWPPVSATLAEPAGPAATGLLPAAPPPLPPAVPAAAPGPAPIPPAGPAAGGTRGVPAPSSGPGSAGSTGILPRLVGREPHLRRIAERLSETGRGMGGVFVVGGESGIGKTRLAEAAAELAGGLGLTVVWSRCAESSGAPAFWPWIQVLQELDEGDGCELGAVLHRLTCDDPGEAADPDTARFLLYDAAAKALSRRAAQTPVLVLMEDVHWADAASLKLLTFLGGDLHRVPLLVLATVRQESAEARPALTAALGELTRQRGTERMTVTAFTPEQIADYLGEAGSVPARPPGASGPVRAPHGPYGADPALVHALHDRTGGNPFFLGELLRLLASVRSLDQVAAEDVASLAVPDGVRDVITQRVSRLPEDSQALLRAAAVIGRDVDADVLEAASGIGGARMMMLLEPAVATGLLTEVDGGWDYRFSHALVRETLYAGLSRLQRAQLHGRVGEAIENLSRGDVTTRLPVLAHHFGMAARVGRSAKAGSYAARAAVQAASHLAYDEAVALWEQALAVLDPAAPDSASARCALLIELGRARRVTGDVIGARAALDEAVTLATRLGDDAAVTEAATVFGGVTLWNWRSYGVVDQRMVGVLEDQLARQAPGREHRRAELLGTLGVELYYGERREEGRRHAAEAVALARRSGDPRLLARTLNNFVIATWTPEDEAEHFQAAEEILTLPELPRVAEIIARLHRMPRLLTSGMLAEYDADLARCLRMTSEVRMPEIETQVTYAATGRAMLGGDWDEVDRLSAIASDSYRRTSLWGPDTLKLLCAAVSCWARGRPPGELLPRLAEAGEDDSNLLLRPTAVLAAVEAGDEALAHRLVDRWGTAAERDWTWRFVVWQWGLVSARIGRPDPHGLLAELTPIASQLVTLGTGCISWGALDDTVALLLRRTGRAGEALAHAERALETHRRLGLGHLERRSAALVRELREG